MGSFISAVDEAKKIVDSLSGKSMTSLKSRVDLEEKKKSMTANKPCSESVEDYYDAKTLPKACTSSNFNSELEEGKRRMQEKLDSSVVVNEVAAQTLPEDSPTKDNTKEDAIEISLKAESDPQSSHGSGMKIKDVRRKVKFEKESHDPTTKVIEEKPEAPTVSKEHSEDALIPLASSSPKDCFHKVSTSPSGIREKSVQSGRYKISTVSEMLETEVGKRASDQIVKML